VSDTYLSQKTDPSALADQQPSEGFLNAKRRRIWREYLTGYAMISPAMILIFVFGLFPVAFALYVSLHKWRLVRTDFIGLDHYINALDNLIYFILFLLSAVCLFGAYRLTGNIRRTAQENEERPWLFIIPCAAFTATIIAFVRWAFLLLPEVLDIADKIRGLEKTRGLFVGLLGDAFRAETVQPAWQLFLGLLVVSIILAVLVNRYKRTSNNVAYQANLTAIWLLLAVGIGLVWVNIRAIEDAYTEAFETGTDPGIWIQLIMLSSGVLLLIIGWKVWQGVDHADSNWEFVLRVLATSALLVGAVLLIFQIPTIVASGDEDMWQGLKVTIFFSMGTVPVQLAISLFLAVLLYQKVAGASAFRMIYFLPYVTPVIASAAVFKQMFSSRATSPANQLLAVFGLEPQLWLREPDGIFTILAAGLGINIPQWAAGPSLALMVIIFHSIWTYVGYNVVIYLAGLVNIPKELNEAAEIDGAGKWESFRYVTFPLLSPTTYFLSLIAIIGTFKAFNTIWILRDGAALGTTDPFSVVIFAEFFEKTRYGYASALAFILFGIIISLTLVNNRVQGSRVFYG
jgi:multiple sugar transport system permease protein